MEAEFVSLLKTMIEAGGITETTLLLFIILLLFLGFKYMLKPMYDKMPNMAEIKVFMAECKEKEKCSLETLSDKIDEINSILENFERTESGHHLITDTVLKKLDEINDILADISKSNGISNRESENLKRDVEHIKELLNQFHGHLLYSGVSRRSSDFGNMELK